MYILLKILHIKQEKWVKHSVSEILIEYSNLLRKEIVQTGHNFQQFALYGQFML